MAAKIEFFPVDNGDMTLLTLESGRQVLIDIHIRQIDDSEESPPDVTTMLRNRLKRDEQNRLYVDAFLLTHPDEDHILGLSEHFHLGPIEDWDEDSDKIIIREMWSSPIIFRRKSTLAEKASVTLCDDAIAWWNEARRRVKAFRDGDGLNDGNRILVLGDDIGDKEAGLEQINIRIGNSFSHICGTEDGSVIIDLLGPLPQQETEEDEEALAKNRSSVIARFRFTIDDTDDAFMFLAGGDAEVFVWERIWDMHKDHPATLSYDLLQTPHHCSFHSMSSDSWSERGEDAKVNSKALNALSQAKKGASIVSSSKPISDDDDDPPCVRAAREYEAIAKRVGGKFICTMTHHGEGEPDVLLFTLGEDGGNKGYHSPIPTGPVISRLDPPTGEFEKHGGGRYA
ncbi:MAG TPA: metallohydrolase [Candidatus Paceibacterota bacterium]|nr:metallohydrolase [Candidatus Paceibacterota bacterium]